MTTPFSEPTDTLWDIRLLELGARVIEAVLRIRLAFAAACPEARLFRQIALTLQPAGP